MSIAHTMRMCLQAFGLPEGDYGEDTTDSEFETEEEGEYYEDEEEEEENPEDGEE